jgi:hypothetical protein
MDDEEIELAINNAINIYLTLVKGPVKYGTMTVDDSVALFSDHLKYRINFKKLPMEEQDRICAIGKELHENDVNWLGLMDKPTGGTTH